MKGTSTVWRLVQLALFCGVALACACGAWAAQVTVVWDANPPAEQVTGYVLHHGPVSRSAPGFENYGVQVDVGNATQYTVDLPVGEYLALTAYNGAGLSSNYSAEVRVVPLPTVPGAPGAPSATATVTDGLGRTVTVTVTITVP